tara:strand:- start:220 stop:765 length:546 start_codon:yes stop_codon:yes gene_type:complete
MAGQRLTDKTALNNHTGTGDLYLITDVSDTTGSSAGTSKKLDSKFVIQTDKITISAAEFGAMDSSGSAGKFKTLVSAPGSGFAIVPISLVVVATNVTAPSIVVATLYAGYLNNSTTQFVYAKSKFMQNFLFANTLVMAKDGNKYSNNTTIDNLPFYMYSSGNFAGNFGADVYITYQIIKLA